MNWLEDLNAAMRYIDAHLAEDVSVATVARVAGCSPFQLERMFPYLAGTTLAEYVRRRKMSQAAIDLREGGDRVIDVALRYGYDSPTAFSRAFRAVHGAAPSAARRPGAVLALYPRLVFTLSVQGGNAMEYRIVESPEFRVVGIQADNGPWSIECAGEKATEFWASVGPRVHDVLACMDGSEPAGLLGVQFCEEGAFDGYMCAVATGAPCPEGMTERVVPAATYAVFSCEGPMPDAMDSLWHRILTEWLPSSGYTWETHADVERYLTPGMTAPDSKSEVWLPVRPAEG